MSTTAVCLVADFPRVGRAPLVYSRNFVLRRLPMRAPCRGGTRLLASRVEAPCGLEGTYTGLRFSVAVSGGDEIGCCVLPVRRKGGRFFLPPPFM